MNLNKIALVSGLVVSGMAVSSVFAPSYAADFTFSLPSSGYSKNGGELTFTQSPLTGIGQETVSLSELPDAEFYYYINTFNNPTPQPDFIFYGYQTVPGSPPAPISFNFNNGNLVGINLTTSYSNKKNFSLADYNFISANLTGTLTLTGNQFQEAYTGSVYTVARDDSNLQNNCPPYPPNYIVGLSCQTVNYNNTTVASGTITFTTITPINPSVPEPLNILGATTGLILFGTVSRAHCATHRKIKRRKLTK